MRQRLDPAQRGGHAAEQERRGENGVADLVEVRRGRDPTRSTRLAFLPGPPPRAPAADRAARCRRRGWTGNRAASPRRPGGASSSRVQPAAAEDGPPTRSPGCTDLIAAAEHVVQPEVLGLRARPEHLQVRLVPHLERPVGGHLVRAVALDQVGGQCSGQVGPAVPVPGRRDDRAVAEDGLVRIAGQVTRHERELDDRSQPDLHQLVVHPVDFAEVVPGPVLAVYAEIIGQDAVRPDGPHAKLLMRDPQRLAQFRADDPASGAVPGAAGRLRCSEPIIGSQGRASSPVTASETSTSIAADPAAAKNGAAATGSGERPGRLPVRDGRHRVVPDPPGLSRRVGVRPGRYGQDVPAAVVQRLERAPGVGGPVHQVPGRTRHRLPVQHHVPAPRDRAQTGWRRQAASPGKVRTAMPIRPPAPAGWEPSCDPHRADLPLLRTYTHNEHGPVSAPLRRPLAQPVIND